MTGVFALRRANGDWFALNYHGRFRMPVFRSSGAAMRVRARNVGMLLFRPAMLDERALKDLKPASSPGEIDYWLVDDPLEDLKYGRSINHAQLLHLIRDSI